ncbi:MAG: hydroxyacid dehydrogenase [Nanoarchaeota archaeon]|nr:hydroxyacid dehydrogenase [Nanoarchaeota archaeon]MBU1631960.1 hydroxyacid dehydrogenase [Nanoarchaeota archaeon]MBU1876417.1 hydroxyacid dehydrogenase [Nanoarchaeota archaeon]
MKIGFFDIEPWEKEFLKKAFPNDKLFFSTGGLNIKNALKYKDLEVVSVFIYSFVNEDLLQKLPKLKLISTRSTGFNHIDLEACKKRRIKVCNVPVYGENTVAEYAFSLILALSRKIVSCVNRVKEGSFDITNLRGFDLQGKTLGVVGCGNIGKHVIRIAKCFEMKIVVFDLYKDFKFAKEMGFEYVSLEKLFKESDIVTLHLPYNKHTHHLVNKKTLSLMKKGSYIINTSRGGIIDTDALVEALKSGKLAGAGLDVLEEETALIEEVQLAKKEHWEKAEKMIIAEDHVLLKMENVIVTPHNAFNTNEALMRILDTTIESIKNFKKKRYINLVKYS